MGLRLSSLEAYQNAYKQSVDDPEGFWAEMAGNFVWDKPWDKVLDWNFNDPDIKWFVNGKCNITVNCLDRHLETKGDVDAIIWEPNNPSADNVRYTYRELYHAVCKAANAFKSLGVGKGDRVCFYMPMVPELVIGILACARIGAIHSVVFAGFSASSLADRVKDAACSLVVCSDFNDRGAKHIPVKQVVDDALATGCESVRNVIVHQNTGDDLQVD